MISPQEKLIKSLKLKVHRKLSFIDLISAILNLNYDAAYRRVNNKTSLSLNEAVKLAKHFSLSLNSLFGVGDNKSVLLTKTKNINNIKDLEAYFVDSNQTFSQLNKKIDVKITYASSDLPVFYFFKTKMLSKFKNYSWLTLLDPTFSDLKMPFSKFEQPSGLTKNVLSLSQKYFKYTNKEIWNANSLDKTIMQIFHFYEIGLLSVLEALDICDEIQLLLKKTESEARAGCRQNHSEAQFTLYHNEIMALGNQILISSTDTKIVLSPYALLSYFVVTNTETCIEIETILKKQLESSNLLSSTDEKSRSLFFNKLHQKINHLKIKIDLDNQMPQI